MPNSMTYRWQYSDHTSNRDITGDLYAEQDADRARAWDGAHGDTCIVEVARTPRNRWRITSVDCSTNLPASTYDRRYPTPLDALQYIAKRQHWIPVEAVCRCGEPGAACD